MVIEDAVFIEGPKVFDHRNNRNKEIKKLKPCCPTFSSQVVSACASWGAVGASWGGLLLAGGLLLFRGLLLGRRKSFWHQNLMLSHRRFGQT